MRKRILRFLLALVMIATLLPMISTTVNAKEYKSGEEANWGDLSPNYDANSEISILRKGSILCHPSWREWIIYETAVSDLNKMNEVLQTGVLLAQGEDHYHWTVPFDCMVMYVYTGGTDYIYLYRLSSPDSVTFRYHPNGGNRDEVFVEWYAPSDYNFPDNHWNYANPSDSYYMTRAGYVATGYYAKADGSCLVHQDTNFNSYDELCAAYGVSTTGEHIIDIYAQWRRPEYQVSFHGNGATGGSMSTQTFTYDTPQALKTNAYERVHTLSYDVTGGNSLPSQTVTATFDGWQDRGSITYNGTTYPYTEFDGQGYAARNTDVVTHISYGNGIMNKEAMIRHYILYGKGEYNNGAGTINRAPITEQIYPYSDGQTVNNLATDDGYTVPLYAMWTPGSVTLPTPTRPGYTFKGWEGNLMENVVLLNGYEHKLNDEYGIIANPSYAVTENFIPVVGGNTYTSNYEVCGLYSYDDNCMYLERSSSYTTTHTVHKDAAYVRIEVNLTKGISYEQYQNELTLMGGIPAGTNYQVGSDQTLKALWDVAYYNVVWKNHDGTVLETDKNLTYGTEPTYNGATPQKPEDENFTYTFNGWSPAVSAVTGDTEYTAQFTAVSKRVEPAYTVTIPATVNEGESFKVSATGVVLNTDETLTVTLQSDFTLTNEQGAQLAFQINDGNIGNNAVVLSITGNGDKNTPLAKDSEVLRIGVAEEAKYSGTYTGTITFTIAVNSAENN